MQRADAPIGFTENGVGDVGQADSSCNIGECGGGSECRARLVSVFAEFEVREVRFPMSSRDRGCSYMVVEQTLIVCTDSKEILQELERESSELRDLIPRGSMLIAEPHDTDGCVLTHPSSEFHTHKDSRGRSDQPCISGGRFGVRGTGGPK